MLTLVLSNTGTFAYAINLLKIYIDKFKYFFLQKNIAKCSAFHIDEKYFMT